jgi:hypothetical protein
MARGDVYSRKRIRSSLAWSKRVSRSSNFLGFLMDEIAVRGAFRSFAGDQQFQAFVRALNIAPVSLKRLRYWQQDLWAAFVALHPTLPADFGEVREAFRICEIHGCRLHRDAVHAPAGQIQSRETQSPDHPFSDELPGIQDCPYSGWGVVPLEWEGCGTRLMEIWYCPECRNKRAALEEGRRRTSRLT